MQHRTKSSTQVEILRYTIFVVLWDHARTGQDLAQSPTIVWRGKQMNVEETPVPEAV